MADAQTRDRLAFVDKRFSFAANTNAFSTGFMTGNGADIAKAKARLTAISAGTYTAAVLNQMTFNDMVFAIRINDEAAGLNW